MSRPSKCRLVANLPGVTYFKPEGIPDKCLEEARISFEEIEALRLKDVEGFEQEAGAAMMHVSRPTFQRILASARRTIAEALLNGKSIRIEGGHFEIITDGESTSPAHNGCPNYGRSPCCKDCPRMPGAPETGSKLTSESASVIRSHSPIHVEKSRQPVGGL